MLFLTPPCIVRTAVPCWQPHLTNGISHALEGCHILCGLLAPVVPVPCNAAVAA